MKNEMINKSMGKNKGGADMMKKNKEVDMMMDHKKAMKHMMKTMNMMERGKK